MAVYRYIKNGGDASAPTSTYGTFDNTKWSTGYATIKAGVEACSAGDVALVSHLHSESLSASTEWNIPSGAAVICVNETTGIEPSTAPSGYHASGNYNLTIDVTNNGDDGAVVIRGLGVYCNHLFMENNDGWRSKCVVDKLRWKRYGSHAVYTNYSGNSSGRYFFTDCVFDLNNNSTDVFIFYNRGSFVHIDKLTLENVNASSRAFYGASNATVDVLIENTDLTSLAGIHNTTYYPGLGRYTIRRCKISPQDFSGTANLGPGVEFFFEECSTATDLSSRLTGLQKGSNRTGYVEHSSTDYRSGSDGSNQWSIKIDPYSATSCNEGEYLESKLPAIWHPAGGSKTLTIFLSGPSGLTNGDVWVEVQSNSETSGCHTPGKRSTTRGQFGSYAALSSDSSSWTNGGTSKYKIEVSGLNPTFPGQITGKICYAKSTSDPIFVCPNMTLA